MTANTELRALLPSAGTTRSESDLRYERHNGVWYWLIYGISAGFLALLLGIAIAAVFLPRIVGAAPLTVLTDSMEPALPPGTLIVVRPIEQAELNRIHAGDIISFLPQAGDRTLVTHRVLRVTLLDNGGFIFTTQGDANPRVDPPVRGNQVRATLWYSIPGLGWLNEIGNEDGGRAWLMPALLGALFVYASYTIISSVHIYVKGKRERGHAGTEGTDVGDNQPRRAAQ